MKKSTKITLLACAFLIYAVQVGHTIYNKVSWPFFPVNMFYRHLPLDNFALWIVLHDDAGQKLYAEPGQVMPLEHFLTSGTIRDIYVNSKDEQKKDAFSHMLLTRLNHLPWEAFDERLGAAVPVAPGSHFVRLDVEKHYYHLKDYTYPHPPEPYRIETIYSQPELPLQTPVNVSS